MKASTKTLAADGPHNIASPGLRLRWLLWRNRLLAQPGFQAWAARFWPTRFVARRRAARLFDLVAGFAYSQLLHAVVTSGLLARLAEAPASAGQVAALLGLPLPATDRLLRAAAAIGLVEPAGQGLWVLGEQGAALAGNPGAQAMVAHHALLYADLADPIALLRRSGGHDARPASGTDDTLAGYWSYAAGGAGDEPARAAAYSALMAASQPMVAAQALGAYRFQRHRRLLDIGGGSGAFLTAVAGAAPGLELGLFDLPAVADIAAEQLAGRGIAAAIHRGDFRRDSLPDGYDCATLVRILHDHDDDLAFALLERVRAALVPGGRLVIIEPMAGTHGAEAMGDAYFGLYLAAMGSGRPRRAEEYGAMLRRAGFADWRERGTALPIVARVLEAST